MPANILRSTTEASEVAAKWGWFVILGTMLIVLGVAAWLDVVSVTQATTVFIGASLLVAGVFQLIHAFMTRRWRGFAFGLLSGLLYFGSGLLIINEPIHGAVVLTLVLAAFIIAGGIIRIVLALRHREVRAWGLVLLSGLVSIVVGSLLYAKLPWSGPLILGTLVAVELLVQGGGWLYFGIALRFVPRTAP